MAVRIRLQRKGKKGRPFYHIVIADGRSPRDGKYIERIGTYNPVSIPAEIDLDLDKAVDWLRKGAQPSDTVKNILSYKGAMYKNHLLKGVDKGALTEEQANARFDVWLSEKQAKVSSKINDQMLAEKEAVRSSLAEETRKKEARAAQIAKRNAAEIEKKVAEAQAAAGIEAPAAEAVVEEAVAEVKEEVAEVVAEVKEEVAEVVAEVKEEVAEAVAEVKEEVAEPVAKAVEETVAEVKEDAPAAEEKPAKEEKPAEEADKKE